eukprot:jgi/Botrbrau1/21457/Bobra.0216s0065.1
MIGVICAASAGLHTEGHPEAGYPGGQSTSPRSGNGLWRVVQSTRTGKRLWRAVHSTMR